MNKQNSQPIKIVSLLPSATEIVCALGLEANLVGITHECDYPASITHLPRLTKSRISHETMTSREIDDHVRAQLDGHGSIYDLNEKLLHELEPDLILTQELCDVCAVSYKTVERAARMFDGDMKVVSLEPNTITDIFANIRTVGELTDHIDEAESVVNRLAARLDALASQTADLETRPRTFVLEWLEPFFAPGHWVPEQVTFAGGVAVLGLAGEPSTTTTVEEISDAQPDVIVLAPCGYFKEDVLRQLESTRFPVAWNELPAVKQNNVWTLDATAYFSRPGVRTVDGTEILARILHPEIFGAPESHQAVRVPPELMRV